MTSHLQSENTASPGNPTECLPESSFADSHQVCTVSEKVLQNSSHYCPSHIALDGYSSPIIPKALYISPYFLTQPWKICNYFFLKTDSLNVFTTSVKVTLLKPSESAMTFFHSFIPQILLSPSCTLCVRFWGIRWSIKQTVICLMGHTLKPSPNYIESVFIMMVILILFLYHHSSLVFQHPELFQ